MSNRMNEFLAFVGSALGLIAILPFEALAWWRNDITAAGGGGDVYHWTNYINAFGQFVFKLSDGSTYTFVDFGSTYTYGGILVLLGAIILLGGSIKGNKALKVIGSIAAIAGPLIFLIAHNNPASLEELYLYSDADHYFGSGDVFYHFIIDNKYGAGNWYLAAGFWLPLAGGALGLLSLFEWRK